MDLEQCFSTGGRIALQGTCGNVWKYFHLSQLGGVPQASSGWRPETLLNIIQCTGRHPTQLAQNVSGAEIEKP